MQRTSTTFRLLWADEDGRETATTAKVYHDVDDGFCDVDDEAREQLPDAADVVLECDPIRGFFA